MRRYLLHTTGNNTLCIVLILLLIASMTLVSVSPVRADPQLPIISLNPMEFTVSAPGQSFTIDVNITGITTNGVVGGLGVWFFKLQYNTTLLDAVRIYNTSDTENCTDWGPEDLGGVFHTDGPPTIMDDEGYVQVGALFPWGQELTGEGTLVKINFTATAEGDCTLHLYETILGDRLGDPIEHVTLPGEITVVPEFPATIVTPLLLITTLAATLAKMVWSRKRKDALTAE